MSNPTQDAEWTQKILDIVNEGMIVIQDEDIIMTNEAFAEMIEYESEEIIDTAFEDLVEPTSRRHDSQKIESLISGKNLSKFSTRLVSKNKSILHVEIKPTSTIMQGHPAVIASIKNISKVIELEAAVTELENRFASLYDMSPVAYFTLNRNGMIEQVNAAAEELLRFDAEDMIGRLITDFLPEPKPGYNPGEDIIREVIRGKSISGLEMEMLGKDGKSIWASVSSRALSSGIERPIEIGLTAIDITRRRIIEQHLREESERANLYLEVMTSDLNMTNQNVLFALEDLSISLELPDRLKGLLSETAWSLRNAGRMIANMGILISLDQSPPDKVQTRLLPHFNKATREAMRDFEWKTLEISTNIENIKFEVVGHAFLWYVFFNIIHYCSSIDTNDIVQVDISAELTEVGDMVRIEFEDYGPGMNDAEKTQIFRRGGEVKEQLAGRGLSLTVVDRYLSDIGGKIWVEDRVSGDYSQGSKFVVLLPAWKEELRIPTILFYKSDHCVFCGPVLNSLVSILSEMGVSTSSIKTINVDDPASGVSEEDLPALPTIHLGEDQMSGYLSEDDLRSAVSKLFFTSG
ncbi:MAG: PAS domain S-box protein [Candidatus Thorarchaeota archaeon]|nr:PAS domain S-box protein [Candidatus Thorarchaeota archaeon]